MFKASHRLTCVALRIIAYKDLRSVGVRHYRIIDSKKHVWNTFQHWISHHNLSTLVFIHLLMRLYSLILFFQLHFHSLIWFFDSIQLWKYNSNIFHNRLWIANIRFSKLRLLLIGKFDQFCENTRWTLVYLNCVIQDFELFYDCNKFFLFEMHWYEFCF